MKNGIGSISSKHELCRSNSHVSLDVTPIEPIQQGQWASLPQELLLDIILRVEESETSWHARVVVVVFCASVCKSWRSATLEIVKTPLQCGRITFPISLKQPGPRDYPMKCFIRRNKRTSTFLLYLGLKPSENESNKLLLAAKRTGNGNFVITLTADDFSQASNKTVGEVRSNLWGNKFSVYNSQPPYDADVQLNCQSSGIFYSKQVSPRIVPACSHLFCAISEELLSRPRRMHCIMKSIPVSTIQNGGNASLSELPGLSESLTLKNKAPIWGDWCKGWYLNFKGRATLASVKNFQFLAVVDPSHNVSPAEQKRVILQFGKIGKDIFTMDYSYPLSAFQAFAICLTSAFAGHIFSSAKSLLYLVVESRYC